MSLLQAFKSAVSIVETAPSMPTGGELPAPSTTPTASAALTTPLEGLPSPTDGSVSPPLGPTTAGPCEWCETSQALLYCTGCRLCLCAECNLGIHEKRRLQGHREFLAMGDPATRRRIAADLAWETEARKPSLPTSRTPSRPLSPVESSAKIKDLENRIRKKNDIIVKLEGLAEHHRKHSLAAAEAASRGMRVRELAGALGRVRVNSQAKIPLFSSIWSQRVAESHERERMEEEDPHQGTSMAARVTMLKAKLTDTQRKLSVYETLTPMQKSGSSASLLSGTGPVEATPGGTGGVSKATLSPGVFPWQNTGRRRSTGGVDRPAVPLNFYSYVPLDDVEQFKKIFSRSVFSKPVLAIYEGMLAGIGELKGMYDGVISSVWAALPAERQTQMLKETQVTLTRVMAQVLEMTKVQCGHIRALIELEHSRRYAACVETGVQATLVQPQQLLMADVTTQYALKIQECEQQAARRQAELSGTISDQRAQIERLYGYIMQLHSAVYTAMNVVVEHGKCRFTDRVLNAALGGASRSIGATRIESDTTNPEEAWRSRADEVVSYDCVLLQKFHRYAQTCSPMQPEAKDFRTVFGSGTSGAFSPPPEGAGGGSSQVTVLATGAGRRSSSLRPKPVETDLRAQRTSVHGSPPRAKSQAQPQHDSSEDEGGSKEVAPAKPDVVMLPSGRASKPVVFSFPGSGNPMSPQQNRSGKPF
eukprot:RCo026805